VVILIWKSERSDQSKKFEDAELLDENSAQTLEVLAEALNVGKSIVSFIRNGKNSKRRQMGSTWIVYLAIQNCLTIYTSLLSRHKKKQFLYQIIINDKNLLL